MRRFLILLAALATLALPQPARAIDPDEMFADPAQEARARALGRQLRCLKCSNQSIFDSNAGLAKDLRVVVRERIAAGDSDEEVMAYVAARFGDYVLLEPRVGGQTYLLWIAPFAFLGLGALAVAGYHRGRRRPSAAPQEMTDEDRAAARKLLNRESG